MRTYKLLIRIIAYACLSMAFFLSCSLLSNEGNSIFDKNGNIIYDIQTDSRLAGIWANVYFGEKEEYSEDIEELDITSLIEFKEDGTTHIIVRHPGLLRTESSKDVHLKTSTWIFQVM